MHNKAFGIFITGLTTYVLNLGIAGNQGLFKLSLSRQIHSYM